MPAKLTYHVAITLDGRIAHPDGSYDGFLDTGDHVDLFTEAIQSYAGVLMGRKTYDLGLQAGLPLGQPAYPGRPNYVFSRTLDAPKQPSPEFELVRGDAVERVLGLKSQTSGTLWLCGGGVLAGALMEAGLVDELLLKVNPRLFGEGRPLADGLTRRHDFELENVHPHTSGVVLLRYRRSL
ncbi:MAG: dihydrofolate reductase family protein [Myxococcota bacterium]